MNRRTMKKIIGLCCATFLLSGCHIYKSYDRPESDSCNFTIYWDADPLAELLDHVSISKWNWNAESTDLLLKIGRASCRERVLRLV